MIRVSTIWLSLLLAGLLHGCVPARFSGYEAYGAGKPERDHCVVGLHELRLVEGPMGVGVHWRATVDEDADGLLLSVYLSIPAGVTVQLLSPDLLLHSESWSQPMILPVHTISTSGPRQLDPDAQLAGSSDASSGMYSLWFHPVTRGASGKTGLPAVTSFSAQLPPLLINDEQWTPGKVQFKRYRRWGIYTC